MHSIMNGDESAEPGRGREDDRGTSEERGDGGDDHRDQCTPDRKRRRSADAASEGEQSRAPAIDPTIEIARGTTDEDWLAHCHEQVPIKLRAKLMDSTPERMGLDLDRTVAGEGASNSCQQVANAAFAQNNPRIEAADVWMAANFECQPGHRDYGAARLFHRLCCAHTFGQYIPPEGDLSGTELAVFPPGIHSGPLNTGTNNDLRDILTAMGDVMQNHAANNLNQAIENIAKIFKPKFDANGPSEETRKRRSNPWRTPK